MYICKKQTHTHHDNKRIINLGVLDMPQAKQVILSDVKDHSGSHNLQYHLLNMKGEITFNNK